jgi:vacuolar-type H+-ATPase subunit H
MTEQVMATEEFVDDILAHYGVKGMRWGVRKQRNADIKSARKRVDRKAAQDFDKLGKLEDKALNAKTSAAREAATKKLTDAEKQINTAHLKDPDRATAMKMTTGEKVALVLIGGLLTGPVIPVGYGAARLAARKTVEKKQREGAYDKR